MSYTTVAIGIFGGFVAGLTGGIIIGRKAVKKEYEASYALEMERGRKEAFDYYSKHPEYNRAILKYSGKEEIDQNAEESFVPEKPKENFKDTGTTVDYADMYPIKVNETESEDQNEEDSLEKQITEQYNEEDKFREPEIISEEEGRSLPRHINLESLFYYKEDDVLTDDYGNIIEEVEFLIGHAIEEIRKYPDKSIVYVMNYNQTICYQVEICEVFSQ